MKLFCATILIAMCSMQCIQAWWLGPPTGTVDIGYDAGRGWTGGASVSWQFSQASCQAVSDDLISRDGWNAVDANRLAPSIEDKQPIPIVYIYMTGECAHDNEAECVRDLQKLALGANKDDIIYNFLVGQDGKIYEGRGWDLAGQHKTYGGKPLGGQGVTISFGFIGNFDQKAPNIASQEAFNDVLRCGKMAGKVTEDVKMDTTAMMAGEAFYAMLTECGGLRIAGNNVCA